jgi:Trk-type K+ transport system membrane component
VYGTVKLMRIKLALLTILIIIVYGFLILMLVILNAPSGPHDNAATSNAISQTNSAIEHAIAQTIAAHTATP